MVIESHALLWWLEGDERLSEPVRRMLDTEAAAPGSLVVSAVTFWELRIKELRGQLTPKKPVPTWPELLRKLPRLRIAEVGLDLWLRVAEMDWKNCDPADRIIATQTPSLETPCR